MKLRRMLALVLTICLLTPAALAAPTRDPQLQEMTVDLGLQTLVEMVLGAAALGDVPGLEENLAPSQILMESLLALGLMNGALQNDAENGKAVLSQETAAAFYDTIFAAGEYAPIEESAFPGLSIADGQLYFDLNALSSNPLIGAHIYSTAYDGEQVTVLCDLYAYYDTYAQQAEVLPENALRWLCHGEITLQYIPEAAYGYLVNSFILSPAYQDGMLSDWQAVENMEFEYSVNLPGILGLAEDAPGHMAWQSADGTVNVMINVDEDNQMSYDEILSRFMLNNPGQTVTEQRDFSQFYAVGEGVYSLLIIPDGLPWAYTLTITFPAERQAEFTLYAEFIRNSMIVWGLSNG